ncbi:MAG: guanylate kinase [Flavobacteriaceae bacterium]|nr:guanylate kinase [Flavobacteriaceae bacterium]
MKSSGKCIIFSAPSGSGKTTLVKDLIDKSKLNLRFSISATTRQKRLKEVNGKDYFFISKAEFQTLVKNDKFLEYEEVYDGVFYGSLKDKVNSLLKDFNIIFDIDVIGGLRLKKYFNEKALAIFIKPPNINELKKRLESRGLDSQESIETRIKKAKTEIDKEDQFDITIINNNLEEAKKDSYNIVKKFLFK